MELRQLRYFVETADCLNFSEAARNLFVSQSSLSEQVKKLEEEIGRPLFVRSSRGVSLTDAGIILLEHARATLRHADACAEVVRENKSELSGDLYVGVTYSFSGILAASLSAFIKMCPNVRLHVLYAPNEQLSELLQQRKIDLALAYQNNRHDNVQSEVLFVDNLCAIMRRDHPLAERKGLKLVDLKGYPLILPTDTLQSRRVLDKELLRSRIQLPYRYEVSDANFLLEMVEQGRYVTVLSGGMVHRHNTLKALPLSFSDNEVYGCIHWLRDDYLKRSARLLIDTLKDNDQVQLIRHMHPLYR